MATSGPVEDPIEEPPVTVYSALFGRFDNPWPQVEQDIAAEWVLFTDDPFLEAPPPWQVVLGTVRYDDPRMSAKWFKCLPHLAIPDRPRTIWLDANMEVTSPVFVREAMASIRNGIAVWRHPSRHCIYPEARLSATLPKYDAERIAQQAEAYRREGHPRLFGLYALGTVARIDNPLIRALGEALLAECELWTPQDQISFPVVCRRAGLVPGTFPYRQIHNRRDLSNPWLRIHPHNRDN